MSPRFSAQVVANTLQRRLAWAARRLRPSPGPRRRLAAAATPPPTGMDAATARRYRDRLARMSPAERRYLDPATLPPSALVQPDDTTCGSATLVAAKMRNDPAYAMVIATGYDPVTDREQAPSTETGSTPARFTDPTLAAVASRFAGEALSMHDATNTWYPKALGTFPSDAAKAMSMAGGCGVPGARYAVTIVDPTAREEAYDHLLAAVRGGHAVPVYSYDVRDLRRAGFHVVLALDAIGDGVRVFNPADGRTHLLTRQQWVEAHAAVPLSWAHPLSIVAPTVDG